MHNSNNPILILLMQIAVILGLSRVMGLLFSKLRQPVVVGEMVAGIMLGPSLLGWLWPGAMDVIFPTNAVIGQPNSIAYLNVLSQVGVIFFLFLIGLELDPKLIRNRGHAAIVISHVSIIAPMLLGAGLALYLYPRVFNNAPHMRFTSVALFMGAAMSITAFPVLARILTERNLHKTKVGAVTITCAAVDDVTAWCMLAFVIGIARAEGMRPALVTAGLSVIYVAVMFFVVRPFLVRLQIFYERQGRLSQNVLAIIFILTLASAYTTELIGIHALFGAFLMGAIMPKGTDFVRTLSEKLEDFTIVFLLPIFFAYTGLRTRIGVLNDMELWFDTFLIIAIACVGKFGGSTFAARACGFKWRESAAIGILMNTRGLMELVILNIGRDLGVITDAVFAMMVIMALVTTALTTPVLHWVYPRRLLDLERAETDKPAAKGYSVLIPVSLPSSGGPLVQMADLLSRNGQNDISSRHIYALYLRRPVEREAYRAGIEGSEEPTHESLEPLLAEAKTRQIDVEPITFVSRDVPSDIARVARARRADLILMGFHKAVIGQAILGGTVHRVLAGTDSDVAIFVDRGFSNIKKILVPFLGSLHDRLALDLAGRMAKTSGASVTVLHVIPPKRRDSEIEKEAKHAVDRVFTDPSQPVPVTFRVIEDPSPVDVVLDQAKQFDLVVFGVAEEWGLESQLFGWRPQRIATECPSSLLIVRKHPAETVPQNG